MSGAELASVFRAIVRARDALARLKSTLSASRGVTDASVGMEISEYELVRKPGVGALSVEMWADAELDDGTARTWHLDLRWDGARWTLESHLLRDGSEGQDELHSFPLRHAGTAGEVARELDHAVRELVALPVTYGG